MTDIAKEYGTALFLLACEEGKRREYAEGLKTVMKAFTDEPQYAELLASPAIGLKDRLDLIEQSFSGFVPLQVLSYTQLMCERGRIRSFSASVDEFMALLDASEQITTATVTSAVELTEDEKARLIASLEAKSGRKIRAQYRVDASLLGGLTVEMDGAVMDGSLKRRLYDIKEVMNK